MNELPGIVVWLIKAIVFIIILVILLNFLAAVIS